ASVAEVRARSAKLYDRLIAPVKDMIPRGRTLCFIPDDFLHYVPFAALLNPVTQQYLVEAHTVFYAPSASLLAWSLDLQRRQEPPPGVLIVSNPTIGKELRLAYPGLDSLRAAEHYDLKIAQLFNGSRVIKNAEATKSAVHAALPQYGIVHFSTHSILN